MENSVDALKMGFAVFIFIFALTLTFSTITQAKETADIVLFANDKTNYYEYEGGIGADGRTVDIATIISTISRCKNETMVVTVRDVDNSEIATFDSTDSDEDLKEQIKTFVSIYINSTDTYLEQFVEAKYSGEEITADDGSTIIKSRGGTKMFITYTKK